MAKRITFICIWMLVFFFGSAMLFGFASGLYFAMSGPPGKQTVSWIRMSSVFVPMVLGPVGLVLGIFGLLPGTRRKSS